MKDHKIHKLHSILIVVDDHADDLNFVRHSIASWIGNTRKTSSNIIYPFNAEVSQSC